MFSGVIIYCCIGVIAGLLAGLLGIGGGLVIVPMLVYVLGSQSANPEILMHIALATSMATIIFTSISSFMAHHKRGAVQWMVVRRIVFGILTGSFLGSYIAAHMSTNILKGFFAFFLYAVASQMLLNKKPKSSRELPQTAGMFAAGNIIGVFSSLVGIGGGTLSVPFMTWCNTPLHKAIGTSSAIGLPIAAAGTMGYVIHGIGVEGLPPFSLGYVHLPALLGISLVSVFFAPLGAKLAHSLPVIRLKKVFALLLFIVGSRMLFSLF